MFEFRPVPAVATEGFITDLALDFGEPLIGCCRFDSRCFYDALSDALALPFPAPLTQAVRKRRAEYLASRYLAREVIQRLGRPGFILGNAADRSPCWPDGIAASLSHSDGIAVLAATRQPICLGIDVERTMTTESAEETADILMTRAEKQRLRQLALPFAEAATLLFSLKESLYKALWPVLHQPMDFHQAELVEVDLAGLRARLRLTHDFSETFCSGRLLEGRFHCQDDRVITLVSCEANEKKPAHELS
ncbi:4'-phosphopantetheinyl transferase superfamily protein [Pantoea sp.]|uniref:4'-phosphopantetheinyl transferase family protein n=1 Tax=Pantoea sp. TaxID=69393 RepID=UPI00289A2202|nr:4'-phosphopantetheinyl transferase superfamily protein [Pantoea sp.]